MSRAPELQTERLVLQPHTANDFSDSTTLWADPAVVRHISGKPSTPEETWSRLLRYVGHWQLLGFGYWVVRSRETGEFLGEAGFADYQRTIEPSLHGKPEAGWVFATAAHGQGYAREAVTCMLDWADNQLGAMATVCIIDPDNIASVKLAHAMGYVQTHATHYHGEPTHLFSRVKPY